MHTNLFAGFSPAIHTRNSEVLRKVRRVYCRGRQGLHGLPEMSNIYGLIFVGGIVLFPQMHISLRTEYTLDDYFRLSSRMNSVVPRLTFAYCLGYKCVPLLKNILITHSIWWNIRTESEQKGTTRGTAYCHSVIPALYKFLIRMLNANGSTIKVKAWRI